MSSSLRAGVAEAARLWPDSAGMVVALGDQPLGGSGILEQLVATFGSRPQGSTKAIVAPRFRGVLGNPVMFARELLPELLAVTGDNGGRSVVVRDASRVAYVDFDRDAPPDVDTVDDLGAFATMSRVNREGIR
jgi:molybdenum cofactor cytidylyltransferase